MSDKYCQIGPWYLKSGHAKSDVSHRQEPLMKAICEDPADLARSIDRITRGRTLTDDVEAALRERLASGMVSAGERLPTESKLAEAFGVSRAVVREAISRLKIDGVVRTVQGSGAFVCEAKPAFRFASGPHSPNRLGEIFELRQMFEGQAAALAATRRTESHLAQLSEALRKMEEGSAGSRGTAADIEFHRIIATAAGNDLFLELYDFIAMHVRESIAAARSNSAKYRLSEAAQREHVAIFKAIHDQNGSRAYRAAAAHVDNVRRRLDLHA
jgi:GntR family transcriptional repressor for pyruvate dehydrogenase complex